MREQDALPALATPARVPGRLRQGARVVPVRPQQRAQLRQ